MALKEHANDRTTRKQDRKQANRTRLPSCGGYRRRARLRRSVGRLLAMAASPFVVAVAVD